MKLEEVEGVAGVTFKEPPRGVLESFPVSADH